MGINNGYFFLKLSAVGFAFTEIKVVHSICLGTEILWDSSYQGDAVRVTSLNTEKINYAGNKDVLCSLGINLHDIKPQSTRKHICKT